MKKGNKKNKSLKIVKIVTISLLIVLVSMIGFVGIYKKNKNQISNTVKDYTYAMDLNGARTIKLVLNTETKKTIKDGNGNVVENATDEEIQKNGYTTEEVPYNSDEVKTEDNYNKSKQIIEKRLKKLGVQDYIVNVNKTTGEIIIEVPEDTKTDKIVSNLTTIGKFEIIDSDTKEVLLDNSNIKSSEVLTSNTTSGTSIYLEIAFNKDGKKKLEEISKTYVKSENTNTTNESADTTTESNDNETAEANVAETNTEDTNTTENNTTESSESTEKKITMKIDDEEIMSTSFDEPITTGKMQLSVGQASTDTSTLQDNIKKAQNVATILDAGNLPLKYNIEKNQYILSDITEQTLIYIAIAFAVLTVIGIIVLIFKYKSNGLVAGISYIGLVAIYLLLIRYANVIVSVPSIFGTAIILILNYILTWMLLKNIKTLSKENKENIINKATSETYKKFFNRIIPICIMVVAFCFVKWIPISSFGMTAFWGLAMIAVYNVVVTRILLKIKTENN